MAFFGRIFSVWLALLVGVEAVRAGGESREQRAYDTAVAAFHDHLWSIAELDFANFIQQFPESPLVTQAGIIEAEAAIKQSKFAPAEALLTSLRPKAGKLADDCLYWIGEAQYQQGDLANAVTTLTSVSTNSPLALPATVEAAAAMAKLGQWPQLVALFQDDAGLFVSAEQSDADNEMVLRGRLLLAQADFAQKKYGAAARLLAAIKPAVLAPEMDWQRLYLLCQVKVAQGDLEPALPLATQLVDTARQLAGGSATVNLPISVALRATILEDLGQFTNAVAAYTENLTTNVPPDLQREAIMKIAALSIDQRQFTNAEIMLNNYVTQFPDAPALDVAWLTLGELYLHDYAGQPGTANLLAAARAWFDELLAKVPNSTFAGKAFLDRGWCGWFAEDYASCLPDFKNATLKLPPSEDLAVAQFKLADSFFAQTNYAAALTNYQAVLLGFANDPPVMQSLGDRALYQSLRSQLHVGDLPGASNTVSRIVATYPVSELSESSSLLLGEGYTDLADPANALAVFKEFLDRSPHSALQPSVHLAIARAYERQQNWPAAVAQYDSWLRDNPTNDLLPQALYSRAWATFQAGDETNALALFTSFVARYNTNSNAPAAQWWIADHYFRTGDSLSAERNYKAIYQNTNWLSSPLCFPAQLMAGRSALLRTDNAAAIRDYFQHLEEDTNCPLEWRIQAAFLHGSALMKMDSSDTNNPTKNYADAVKVFGGICQAFPTNETGARAWGMAGDCYLQLARYDDATNAYGQAMSYAGPNLNVQNQAQIGLAVVLEKKAALLPLGSPEQSNLLTQAEANYYNVLQTEAGHGNEAEWWGKEAGLKGAALAEGRGEWEQAVHFYEVLLRLMPQLHDSLTRKMEIANQHLNAVKKTVP